MRDLIIKELEVIRAGKTYKYIFSSDSLIHSKENSKGKTSLLRFLLYSLGFQIPATEGLKDFGDFDFRLRLELKNTSLALHRQNNSIELSIGSNTVQYCLPEQEDELHASLFGIDNRLLLDNILATFYIDQEKGWTLLNRGKIIGNNRFNIDEFVAGVSHSRIDDLINEKKQIDNYLKRYRALRDVIGNDTGKYYDDSTTARDAYDHTNIQDLSRAQMGQEFLMRYHSGERKRINEILKRDNMVAETIESFGIVVSRNGENFTLKRGDLAYFDVNRKLLKMKKSEHQVAYEKAKSERDKIVAEINKKNMLVNVNSVLDELQQNVKELHISIQQIDNIIRQLRNRQANINMQLKERLTLTNEHLAYMHETAISYARELGIDQYMGDSPKFMLTNRLKGLSGRVMAQMTYVFKLSYVKTVEKYCELALPLIIDSPKTNELSDESTNNMMKILKRDFSNHQIIIASIYKIGVEDFEIIDFNDGLFSDNFKISE